MGLNHKGVFTRDRRPKMAAHLLRRRWFVEAEQPRAWQGLGSVPLLQNLAAAPAVAAVAAAGGPASGSGGSGGGRAAGGSSDEHHHAAKRARNAPTDSR